MTKQEIRVGFYKFANSNKVYQITKSEDCIWEKEKSKIELVWIQWDLVKDNHYKTTGKTLPAEIIKLDVFEYMGNFEYEISDNKTLILYDGIKETNIFLVRFDAKLIINGQIQVEAKTQEEAEGLAEMILQETLNCKDCLVELKNDVSIREMEVEGTFNGINIDDATVLN